MRRAVALALTAVAVAGVAAGCAPEDDQQRVARLAAQDWAAESQRVARYDVDDTHCTSSAREGWVGRRFTGVFFCAIRRRDASCDLVRVTFADGRIGVALDRERVVCVLPD